MVKCINCVRWVLALSVVAVEFPLAQAGDLRSAAPPDAFVAVYARHNPERDAERQHFQAVWKVAQDEQLLSRLAGIIGNNVPSDDRAQAESVVNELKEATSPIDWNHLPICQEFVYAQKIRFPFQEQMMCFRSTLEDTNKFHQAIANVFAVLHRHNEKVQVTTSMEGETKFVSLSLPGNLPWQPTCAATNDVLILASHLEVAQLTAERLKDANQKSKFDDPRVLNALTQLPEPEDALSVFDGRQYFSQLHQLSAFIDQEAAAEAGSAKAEKIQKVKAMIRAIFDNVDIIDLIVTSEYTEDHQHRSVAFGKLAPNVEDKVLFKVLGSGEPFEDWSRWVPADVTSFSLTSGANLRPLYEWVIEIIGETIPDAKSGLDRWEQVQEKIGVHLDRDILQSFSGEFVSFELPAQRESNWPSSVLLLKCAQPDRIRELLHLGMQKLSELPALQPQQAHWEAVEGLDGFEQASLVSLNQFGVKPVIGEYEGWWVIASDAAAVKQMQAVRAGEQASFATAEAYKQAGLNISGPVAAISYRNTAARIRGVAKGLRQAAAFAPVGLAMAGPKADEKAVKVIGELAGLLPALARVVESCDFYESKLAVTQAGKEPGTWITQSVVRVRPPAAEVSPPEVQGELIESR